MEDIPPSYYQSTNPSVLDLIAPYLDTPSLHSLVLVSRSYNETFMPHLWGSPASHFVPMTAPKSPGSSRALRTQSSYDDMVYVALTRFKRILRIARESTRRLVHTLYLPAAASEIYSGPNATWLREILDGLPNLQSLCLSSLPFFDHHSLVAVDRHRPSYPTQGHVTYPVKLLLAAKESNTTSIGLSLFLPHLSSLVYLDLSHTNPARDMNVLSSFSVLPDLQILKLRGIGLRDLEAEALANAIGLRVRLLDIAENYLGDTALRSLLQACFMHPTGIPGSDQTYGHSSSHYSRAAPYNRRHLESWPVGLPPAPDFLSLDTLRSADFDKNLLSQLTHPLTGRLAFEDIPHSGITHLYINGNPAITIEGIKSLLEIGRLHVLDAGDIAGETAVDKYVKSAQHSGKWHGRTKSTGSMGTSIPGSRVSGSRDDVDAEESKPSTEDMHLPGAEKLIPVLREKASKTLTYLRLEHTIITKEIVEAKKEENKAKAKIKSTGSATAELSGVTGETGVLEAPGSNYHAVEAPGSSYHAVEMPSESNVFELDATPVIRAELPGDLIHFAISPPIGDRPENPPSRTENVSPIRGEGPYAPEVLQVGDKDEEKILIPPPNVESNVRFVSTNSLPPAASSVNGSSSSIDTIVQSSRRIITSQTALPTIDRRAEMDRLTKMRPNDKGPRLHPSSLPNLRTLVLTDVPDKVAGKDSPILKSIKDFIAASASEAFLAILRAKTNYSLPPGRARAAAEWKHAQSLFALRTIVLEVSPVMDNRQRDWKHTRQRLNLSKSSTGDNDSEALWSAAENDFSFFGEEGEEQDECGIYDHEPSKYFPSLYVDEKFAIAAENGSPPTSSFSPATNFNLGSSTGTMFRSPRELPLGRNRRASNETRFSGSISIHDRSSFHEMQGTIPTSQPRSPPPTSMPKPAPAPELVDFVTELSLWRRERKAAYEQEVLKRNRVDGVTVLGRVADTEIYVEGHWKGEIKVVRNSKPVGTSVHRGQGRLERNGMVDVYGNYFEKGYLYS